VFEDLAEIVRLLQSRGVPHALIGAAAMAGLGVVRASDDVDLLVTDRAVLADAFWAPLARRLAVDARAGDDSDPLAGVVRLSSADGLPIDVVVGKRPWQGEIVARARPIRLGGVDVPLAGAADLVLLKLYAGGPQDAADVRLILGASDPAAVRAEVESRLPALPPESVALWRTIADPP
jgi:predicted nucleotidyltransferase